jgi:hypothetical protein
LRRGIRNAIVGAVITAAVSTLGDYLWANVLPHHRPIYGLAHGALLFLTVGLCLGAAGHKPMTGAAGGAAIGFSAAAGFYLLQPFIGYAGLFMMFIGLWMALGLLNGRILARDTMRVVLVRSALAAIGSGLGFYAISGIWFPFDPHGWDYAMHFACWTAAYLPGFGALLSRRVTEITEATV